MNLEKRLRELEKRFAGTDDRRLLDTIASACRGDQDARLELKRIVASGQQFSGHLIDLAEVFLAAFPGGAPQWDKSEGEPA